MLWLIRPDYMKYKILCSWLHQVQIKYDRSTRHRGKQSQSQGNLACHRGRKIGKFIDTNKRQNDTKNKIRHAQNIIQKWYKMPQFHIFAGPICPYKACKLCIEIHWVTYVLENKLGTSQIWWLSELVLFNFVIKYQTGHSNRDAGAHSDCPFIPSCDIESKSETDSDEVKVISYSLVCEAIDECLNSTKVPENLKQEAQNINCSVQSIAEGEDKDEVVSA